MCRVCSANHNVMPIAASWTSSTILTSTVSRLCQICTSKYVRAVTWELRTLGRLVCTGRRIGPHKQSDHLGARSLKLQGSDSPTALGNSTYQYSYNTYVAMTAIQAQHEYILLSQTHQNPRKGAWKAGCMSTELAEIRSPTHRRRRVRG